MGEDSLIGWRRADSLVAVFVAVLVVLGLVAQALSSIPPSEEGAPIEAFTAALLWIASVVGLLRATDSLARPTRGTTLWLALAVAAAALAIDETIGVHERTEPELNDDWFKLLLWLGTAFGLRAVYVMEGSPRLALGGFGLGYVFHTLYLVVEMGDGEIFRLPDSVSVSTLKSAEEVFELFFLALYVGVLLLLLVRSRRPDGAE